MRYKVTVVGAGNVGATAAQRIAQKGYADVVLVDIIEGVPQGKALDLMQSGPVEGYDVRITGSNGYDETPGSDVVVITAGGPRQPRTHPGQTPPPKHGEPGGGPAGSAYYAPSAAVVEMVDSILTDRKKILPCAAYLEGEYGIKGLFCGVPVKLGAGGVEKILELPLNPEEKGMLERSAASVRELVGI